MQYVKQRTVLKKETLHFRPTLFCNLTPPIKPRLQFYFLHRTTKYSFIFLYDHSQIHSDQSVSFYKHRLLFKTSLATIDTKMVIFIIWLEWATFIVNVIHSLIKQLFYVHKHYNELKIEYNFVDLL